MNGDRDAVVRESADLLYNIVVLWAASGIRPADVWKEMSRREQLFGIAEKLLKHDLAKGAVKVGGVKISGAKVAALPDRQVRHRR
jgi:phosphoribosyl-ATP pyrophosphohydrolase